MVFLQRSGTIGKAVGRGVGGVGGKALASKLGGNDSAELVTDAGIAATFKSGPNVIGPTNQRVLVYSYGSMSGKPKELETSIPARDVVGIDSAKQKASRRSVMRFSDGTARAYEAPRINNDREHFAEAVNSR